MDLLFLGLSLLGLAAGISVIDRFRAVSREQDEMTEALVRPLDESSCEPGPVK